MKTTFYLFIALTSILSNAQEQKDSIFVKDPSENLDEIVVTGTMKAVRKSDSPVPIEIYTPKFFQKNPTPSLFDAVQLINGVQPQLNCNVCNTGDIHINGMEGPYTMILIDGMPIVSSLSTVYGLSGIPNSLVERIEVVKGPASSLYGTEAMGGIINVITKSPKSAPKLSLDAFTTSWLETNFDGGYKYNLGEKVNGLFGFNYFKYGNKKDKNNDGFTDVTLQDRITLFNKFDFERQENRTASVALRYLYEDRWGGQMNWKRKLHRGSDEVYAESIMTNRFEAIGMYQLPLKEKIMTQFSYNFHQQNSFYGPESYQGKQQGIFVQDEWTLNSENKLLLGYRFDYDKTHKGIHSPRVAYKFSPSSHHTLRASFGTGFRVVNVFTEDHRALTGARQVVFENELKPEKSYNGNINYVFKLPTSFAALNFDFTTFYSYFTNKIIADTDTDETKIIYDNLDGHAISQGVSLNIDATFDFPLKIMLGATYMDVYKKEDGEKEVQYHAPKWSGNFLASYTFKKGFTVDLTANYNDKMKLPQVENDYRPEYSKPTVIANIQLSKSFKNNIEIYGGIKNIFNVLPKGDVIARWWDPFGEPGNGVTPPKGRNDVIFEPNDYSYTPMQGTRGFIGVRYNLR